MQLKIIHKIKNKIQEKLSKRDLVAITAFATNFRLKKKHNSSNFLDR
jgi:hypothetical protein